MNILVIGGGGREHAIAWKLARSPKVGRVYVAPGNGGTSQDEGMVNLAANSVEEWLAVARTNQIHFTVVGPEAPLADGVVDAFQAAGLPIFGPTKAAARLESSKVYAKEFMQRHNIPTANWRSFINLYEAQSYIHTLSQPPVIKADGLAAGKGVVVTDNMMEARAALTVMMEGSLGSAGQQVVIEERLHGLEVSFIVLCSGTHCISLAPCQDYKRLLDGDQGPNTGGMGAFCPSLRVTPEVHARIMQKIVNPTLAGLQRDGIPYEGFLYFGLMIDEEGQPQLLEYNCRLGDPETQVLMLRMKSDFFDLIEAVRKGEADSMAVQWDRRVAVGVVAAAAGYPNEVVIGDKISIPPLLLKGYEDAWIFHSGTEFVDGQLRTKGGRVVCVTALGDNQRGARDYAYRLLQDVRFTGQQYRSDIAKLQRG